jgi:triacylglycerol lipase
MHYWSTILGILRKTVGAEVIVTAVPGTGSITSRADQLDRFLQNKALGRGINFMAHSMGGLDCRHLITHVKPVDYTPLSLTTIATPHRGSPFMDWCKARRYTHHLGATNRLTTPLCGDQEYLGLGRRRFGEEKPVSTSTGVITTAAVKTEASHFASAGSPSAFSFSSLPSSFTTFLLGMFDSPAYANLTTSYLTNIFNPRTPDDPRVRYFSVAGRTGSLNIWHPLWLPKLVLDGADGGEGNDGLVSVESARWGEFLGALEGADHWALRGASGIEFLDTNLASIVGRDAWGLADWGRFVRAHGRVGGSVEGGQQAQGTSASGWQEDRPLSSPSSSSSDEGLRSSTERLSAVFDWLVEQVPIGSRNALSFAGDGDSKSGGVGGAGGAGAKQMEDATSLGKKEGNGKGDGRRGDLESKRDLERLYVALARKLYDEGL